METTHTSHQLVAFLKLLQDKRMTPERFTMVLSSGILADTFDPDAYLGDRAAVRLALKLVAVMPGIFNFEVNYDQAFDAMVAAGYFNDLRSTAADVAKEFLPIRGKGIVKYEGRLVYFNRVIKLDAALKAIRSVDTTSPFRAAKIEHMLAFAAAFPNIQREHRILGLGSVAEFGAPDRRYRAVPELGADETHGRFLYREGIDGGFEEHYLFLTVRESSKAM